jgi:Na+/phosphate symporter
MGIFLIVFIVIVLIIFFISRLKIPMLQKIVWSVLAFTIMISLIVFLFIQGFEKGRDPLAPSHEELNQPIE